MKKNEIESHQLGLRMQSSVLQKISAKTKVRIFRRWKTYQLGPKAHPNVLLWRKEDKKKKSQIGKFERVRTLISHKEVAQVQTMNQSSKERTKNSL